MEFFISLTLLLTHPAYSNYQSDPLPHKKIVAMSSYDGELLTDSLIFTYGKETLARVNGAWTETQYVADTQGQLQKDIYLDLEYEAPFPDTIHYIYENSLLKKKVFAYAAFGDPGEVEYYYTNGRIDSAITRVSLQRGMFNYTTEVYSTDRKNQITEVASYWGNGYDKRLYQRIQYEYDTHPNPLHTFKSVNILNDPTGAVNNIIHIKVTDYNSGIEEVSEVFYTYTYGKDNYPVSRTSKTNIISEELVGIDDTPLLRYYYN